jgi:hypothetical protein
VNLKGWYIALREYLRTPKGAFDCRDYLKAFLLIILTCALCMFVLHLGGGL